jgi:hypothetical protein
MNKHTPGPWQWIGDNLVSGDFYEAKESVLSAYMDKISGSEADMNLIAAAPELLEALRNLLKATKSIWKDHAVLDGYPEYVFSVCAVEIAINKATGEQP